MTRDELVAFICEDAGLDQSEIDDETLLFTDGYIDSFTMASIVAFLEEKLGVEIKQSIVTLENFDSVARIMRTAERLNVA